MPYRFGVLDSEIVGAFALPGGFIFITKTAHEGMTNEAQLAGALGHEIVHVSERHLESAIRGKKNSAWATEEAKAEAFNQAVPIILRKRADAFLNDMFNMRLSRDKEDGADERGTLMAAQAGYAAERPAGVSAHALRRRRRKPENQRAFGQLLSTHPPFDERVAHLTPIVQKNAQNGKTLEARFRGVAKIGSLYSPQTRKRLRRGLADSDGGADRAVLLPRAAAARSTGWRIARRTGACMATLDPAKADHDIVVIDIDNASYPRADGGAGSAGPGRGESGPSWCATCRGGKPKLILFDILFSGAEPDSGVDQDFAAAMRERAT